MLQRYGDIRYIMELPLDEGIELYYKAIEKNIEKASWDKWLVDYQRMTPDNFIPFSEYLKKVKSPPPAKDHRTEKEVIDDAENILKMMKRT